MKRCPGCSAGCFDSHRHCPSCGTDLSHVAVVDGDPFLNATFAGKYRITELIGIGAMGRVYRAKHLALDAEVAVKVVNPDVAADAQTARRFQTEARAASRLRHPNTIHIVDFGQSESGALFLVMEYLRGRTLARILEEESVVGPRRIADLLGQALSALDEAHASGIVHRDFKPENVFVETLRTGKEHVKVLDFGIAKLRGEADANLTSRGAVCGTPEYMSPEQIRGEELDARSDVYAAGVVLYELLTGGRPFETHGPVIEILQAHLNTPPQPPRQRRPDLEIPRAIEEVCLRALAKTPEERQRSAAELKAAIEGAVRGLSGSHCAACGMPLPSTARFCPECGAVLRPTAATAALEGSAPPPQTLRLPLPVVGRESVLERLDGLDGEAVLLMGAAGVGKSAVVEAWRKRRQAQGRRVVVAGADPSGALAPWWPLRHAMAQLLGVTVRPSAEELERATPTQPAERIGLGELFGVGGTALPLDVRRRECEAATLQVMRRSGASFLFEDVDRYDGPSRRTLGRLVASPGSSTVLATAQHAEALAVEIEVVRLGPLDNAAVDELAQLGLPPGVAELSGGQPLAIEQWLRARAEGARDSSVAARLDKLPAAARALVETAAVGGGLPRAIVAEVAGVADLAQAMSDLTLRGWVRADATAVELASPTLRRRVYDALPEERQRALHARLAAALAKGPADPILVGHHAYASGELGTAAVVERAGDSARERFDDDASARWYRAALERGRQALAAGVGDESRQIRIALKLGIVLRYRGDVVQSEHVLRDALDLATLRGDRWAQVQARRALARLAAQWQQHDAAREHLLAAVNAALGASDAATLAELYLELADVLGKMGDADAAERELWEGVMLVTGGDGPEATAGPEPLWRMLLALGELSRTRRDARAAQSLAKHALRHADRVGSPLARARAHAFFGAVYDDQGRPADAAAARRAAVDELRRTGDRRATAEMLIALAEGKGGDKAAAQGWVREAEALADQLGWHEGVTRSRAAAASLR